MSGPDTRARAEAVLRRLAGDGARLRDDQWRAIEALVVDCRRVLCVQRTGWGKSAVYFVATALLRERGAGPSVIVSPLLALMRNQIEAAGRAGINARTINSANIEEWDAVTAEITAGAVDVLLVSPERLNNPDFRDAVLPRLAATTGLLVVDEAHCVSDWGHDFRPDYRRLRTLLAGLPPGTPVLATTATANSRVTDDVAEQLGTGREALVLRGPLDRESLRLAMVDLPTPAHRLGWLADHLDALPGSGIIYTLTVAGAGETAEFLRGRGYPAAAYTGQAEDADRRAAERDLLDNKLKALVATSALGMGFDKPDLGFVVHLGAPPSPIAYYQQVGRAGRAVTSAEVVLLPGAEDAAIWRYFASLAFPAEDQVRRVLAALEAAGRALSIPALEPLVDLRRGRLEMMLKVLDVDGAVRRVRGGWTATGEPWHYDAARHRRIAQARAAEQQAMREYAGTAGCRMELLRRCLDDPAAAPCGRCDRCTGRGWPTEVSPAAFAAAQAFLTRPGAGLAPRRQWPTGLAAVGVPLSGRIPAGELAEPGRAVGRLSDLGWGARLRELVGEEAPDGPVPDDVFAAVVQVLADWARGDDPWPARPVAVVRVGSRRRPQLGASLASRVAAVGRLPLWGTVEPVGAVQPGAAQLGGTQPSAAPLAGSTAPAGRANSAQRVRALYGAFQLPPLPPATGPVLLVDDYVDSGWTLALVARELRRAGVPGVLPLALAVTG
ncbi:MAG TPA: DEAD/DEAH box helicase [Micromonosporaceae bacterium]|nr:DEAD/DEAH box helicase [Micromonosporaceae bacterium]